MDLFDFLWNVNQEHQIEDLRGQMNQVSIDHAAKNLGTAKELVAENLELKLRLGLLVRLLIAKGIFTSQEYASLIANAHTGK
jgi:hypothetical protein